MSNIIELFKKDGTIENIEAYPGLNIVFSGDGNNVKIHEGTKFSGSRMILQNRTSVQIGQSIYGINNLGIWGADDSVVQIGDNFSCWGVQIRCHEKESSVIIGNDCMFSEEILIYPTDVHAIYDIFDRKVLNKASPIILGNNVWCGRRVSILKGVTIRNNVVIGMGAIVTKKFNENNIIVTGNPAEVVKRGVAWDRSSPQKFELDNL